jgi:hypothetical protein
MNEIIFVSCFVQIYNDIIPHNERTYDWRINHFKSLLKTGITCVIFISPLFEPKFKFLRLIYPNLTYKIIDIYKELPLFANKPLTPTLPQTRNDKKDTYEYMALMNSKLHLILMAMLVNPTAQYFAWIDFNIPYIFKEPDMTFSFLSFLARRPPLKPQFLYIPGCWNPLPTNAPLITDAVQWRFCGGFFIGDKASLLEFNSAVVNNQREQFIDPARMVWETNYWAFLECNGKWRPSHWVYVSDHDDTMITKFPTELYITPLMWLHSLPFSEPNVPVPGYHASSISYTKEETTNIEYLVCRMINYKLSDDGRQYIYDMLPHTIQNINILINTSNNIATIIDTSNMIEHTGSYSRGLEDMRIYPDMTFSANSVSFTNGNTPQIVYGSLDPLKGVVTARHIKSPRNDAECEKNWIFIDSPGDNEVKRFIYKWSPYEIGVLESGADTVNIVQRVALSPQYIFKNMRGSTNFTPFCISKPGGDNWLVGVSHYSIDQPYYSDIVRKYYHCMVLLHPETLVPHYITNPFTFCEKQAIEFCIGMRYNEDDGIFTFWVSIMDQSPIIFFIHRDSVEFTIPIGRTMVQ